MYHQHKEQQETFDSEDIQVSIFHCNYINNFKNENYIKLVDIYKNNFFKENVFVKKNELKFGLNNDPNMYTTIQTQLAGKQNKFLIGELPLTNSGRLFDLNKGV